MRSGKGETPRFQRIVCPLALVGLVVLGSDPSLSQDEPLSRTHPWHSPGRPLPPDFDNGPILEDGQPKHCFIPGHPNPNPDFQYSKKLSKACNNDKFREQIPFRVKAWFDYGARQVPYGVANDYFNLHDPNDLSEPDETYFFYRGPDDECLVYVRNNETTGRLICY